MISSFDVLGHRVRHAVRQVAAVLQEGGDDREPQDAVEVLFAVRLRNRDANLVHALFDLDRAAHVHDLLLLRDTRVYSGSPDGTIESSPESQGTKTRPGGWGRPEAGRAP